MKRLLAALFLVAIALSLEAREGFGFMKKAVDMTRTIPPVTNAGARRVAVKVEADRGGDEDDARTMQRYINDHILAGKGTVADNKAEVTIEVSIGRLESHETWETYTEYERQQTGTKREWNESKKRYEDKPVYSSVPVQKERKVLDASLDGSYDISARNKDVASGSIEEKFHETYGDNSSAPAPSAVEDDLLKKVARKIAAQIVPTQDRVAILVPRASFEKLIPLAESGEWDRYLLAVEEMPAPKNPKDEAYRQYALAVAKEGLAYGKDRGEAVELLRAAKSHYSTAAALNPGEELFRSGYSSLLSSNIGSPTARVSESVSKYDAWTIPGSGAVRVASKDPVVPQAAGMKNQTVIELAKAGLPDDSIIAAIDAAPSTRFDVSVEGVNALTRAGVSKGVIAHMREKKKK